MIMMALMTRCPFKVMKETGGALCVAEEATERAGSGLQDSAKHKKTLVVKNKAETMTTVHCVGPVISQCYRKLV